MRISRSVLLVFLLLCISPRGASNVVSRTAKQSPPPIAAPTNCESNAITLDTVHQMAGEDGLIIAIAHLGSGEQRRGPNRRRLNSVVVHLTARGLKRSRQTVVAGEGERVKGYGRVDLYVAGKLVAVLAAERNRNLPVDSCDR